MANGCSLRYYLVSAAFYLHKKVSRLGRFSIFVYKLPTYVVYFIFAQWTVDICRSLRFIIHLLFLALFKQKNYNNVYGGMNMDYMTFKEASGKWGVSARKIN